MVVHADETIEGINFTLHHPDVTFNIIKQGIEDSYQRDVVNGDSYTQARWFSYAVGMVGTSIVGSKGVDKAAKAAKAGKVGQVAAKATKASKKVSKQALEKSVASFKKSIQRVASNIKGIQIHNPFAPQIQLAGGGKVPYHAINGEHIKDSLIQFAKKVSDISRKPFTGGKISVPWLNKEKYNAVEVKGKVKPKGNLKDVDRRIYQLKNIDFNMKHPNKNITNLELMKSAKAPIGEDGKPINLHHLIQKEPGTMLEILHTTHKKYHKVLHQLVEKGDSFRNNPELQQQYDSFRRKYWMWRAEQYEKSLKGGSQ